MKAEGGVTHLTWVISIRAFTNMAANHCKPGELFRRFHLRNVEQKSFSEDNTGEVDGASDNLSVESDNEVGLLKHLKEYKVTCDFNEKDFERTCRRCTQRLDDA